MSNKYELTDDTIIINGHTLYRIKALRDFYNVATGDLGGYVQNEKNLNHYGDCWIYHDAKVYEDARIYGNAAVCGNARIHDHVKIYDSANVYNNAHVHDNAQIYGNASIYNNAHIHGNAFIYNNNIICNDADISSNDDYITIGGIGSQNRNTIAFKQRDCSIYIKCGCYRGTLSAFEQRVVITYSTNKYAREYLAFIQLVKIHFEIK